MTLFTNIGCLVTVRAQGPDGNTGAAMRDLGVVTGAAVIADDVVRWIGPAADAEAALIGLGIDEADVVDCEGRTMMPGFVDSHTHIVFAGSRSGEFARRLAGVPYATIAAEGGGILTTMKAVREADVDTLADQCERLATSAMEHGTTTIEVKSGYGLSLESELRLLEAVDQVRADHAVHMVPTFLGAHAVPPEFAGRADDYVQHIIDDMLPAVAAQGIAEFCDVFTDAGFFSVEQSERLLRAAAAHGLGLKVHADEIARIGATAMAARVKAISADHCEHTVLEDMLAMRDAGVIATLLPGTAYTLRLPYPDARTMIDNGLVVALATDCNPGSCYCENMQMILSLACMGMAMSIEEAITAATLHGARALGLQDHIGSIEVGKAAHLVIYDVAHYAELVYHFGTNAVWSVWIDGEEW